MRGLSWLRRRWKWIAAGVVAAALPPVLFAFENERRWELLAGLSDTSVRAVPWVPSSLEPAFAWAGIGPGELPILLWQLKIPETVEIGGGYGCCGGPPEMDSTVDALNRLGGVRSVKLGRGFGGDELRALRRLETLEDLRFEERYGIGDIDLSAVAEIRSLRCLRVAHGCRLSAAGIASLGGLPNLARLDLPGCVRRTELSAIAELKGLEELNLDGNAAIQASDLAPLTSLPRLKRLSLVGGLRELISTRARFEQNVVPVIAAMPALQELRVGLRGDISDDRIEKLRAVRPNLCVVEVDASRLEHYDLADW